MQSGERFDLNDFRAQITQMRKLGGISSLIDKLPAQFAQATAGKVNDADADRSIRRIEGIILSMTPQERHKPELIKASRKRRIAAGAGVPVQEVNRMLNQFEQMQSMMKQMRKGGMAKMMRGLGGLAGLKGGGFPGAPRR
jgi:signal recognition particle subunit SRP54